MTIGDAFNSSASYYDNWVQKALPGFDDIFATALEVMPFDLQTHVRVLDLGAGTGLFSLYTLKKYSNARFVLYDLADKMLDVARERFAGYPEQFIYTVGDYRSLQTAERFDLVISSLSIHHLTDPDKRDLFGRIHELLNERGAFINVDQIKGDAPYLEELYWSQWLNKERSNGATEEEIAASIERRKIYDKEATLTEQVRWLKEAGFSIVDCVYKNYFIGVFLAIKGKFGS
jgi:tRNA (cmo5U34)-methyltransferase